MIEGGLGVGMFVLAVAMFLKHQAERRFMGASQTDRVPLSMNSSPSRLFCNGSAARRSVARASGRRRSTRRGGGLLRVENRACSAPRLLLCLGQRDELLQVTWHRVEPTAGPLLLRLLDALWPG